MLDDDKKDLEHAKELLESSFDYLKTDKPLITIPSNRLEEFSSIITHYDWKESIRTNEYLSEEVIFNSPKSLVKTK